MLRTLLVYVVFLCCASAQAQGPEKVLQQAIARLAPFEKESADDAAFNYLYGTALIRDQQAARGATVIDRILRQGDSAEARLLLGTTKMFANDYAGALPDLKKAVELNPN